MKRREHPLNATEVKISSNGSSAQTATRTGKKTRTRTQPAETSDNGHVPELLPTPVVLLNRVSRHPDRVALRVKRNGRYHDIKWQEYGENCELAAGLLALGLERGETVGLQTANRPEFLYSDMGVLIAGGVTVAVYPNTNAQGLAYILNHSEARFLIIDTLERFQKLSDVAGELEHLEHIFVIEWQKGLKAGNRIKVRSFEELLEMGREAIDSDPETIARAMGALNLDDTSIIIYTSGTTGPPKGAMLTHRNISFICQTMHNITVELAEHEVFISFLPLAHALERIGCLYFSIHNGGTIGFAERLETVAVDILEIKPTVLYGVPRFFEKIYNGVLASVEAAAWPKQKIFKWAVSVGKQVAMRKVRGRKIGLVLRLKYWVAERLVFQNMRARLGGRVKYIVSGGAPLAAAISEFFYSAGMPIMEAYGATETSAPATVTRPDSLRFGTVGKPLPNVDVKLAEDGEILIRGEGVCKGYYKDREATARTFIDGWYNSGDIGHFDEEGNLVITDRKKDIIITSAGKNIPPANIENVLKTSAYINQAMVHGDKRKYLTALVTLNPETVLPFAEREGLAGKTIAELAQDEKVFKLIEQEIIAKNRELAGYERIKKFIILGEDFTVESGELTPTLKVKRKVVTEKYKDLLDSMYEKEFSSALVD